MVYKSKRTWKDVAEPCKNSGFTRRELLARGMATSVLSVAMYDIVLGELLTKAAAEEAPCAAGTSLSSFARGCIAQILSEDGPTMSARFISDAQADIVNSDTSANKIVAKNYGISGNLRKLGPNLNIDTMSPFGVTLLAGPPGYPGGSAAWQTNVLTKVAGAGHLGVFRNDDGAGRLKKDGYGLLGGMSPYRKSEVGKDLRIDGSTAVFDLATWSEGLPAASVALNGTFQPDSFANVFSMTPAAANLTNSNALGSASKASGSISAALGNIFKTPRRKGAGTVMQQAACAFEGNKQLADPNYGKSLFNPALQSDLTNKMNVAGLTNENKAMLGAYYQSAMGRVGGVVTNFGGRDYHAQSAATIGKADIEEAEAIVMFLAACEAANAPGAMIYVSNGHASGDGTLDLNGTIFGTQTAVKPPKAKADSGGFYSAGLVIFYSPTKANAGLTATRFTGAIASDGGVTADGAIASPSQAMAGLYLSAFKFVKPGDTAFADLEKAVKASGVTVSDGIMVIG